MMNTEISVTICLGLNPACPKENLKIEWISKEGLLVPCIEENCITIKPDLTVNPDQRCLEGYIYCDDCDSKPVYFRKCFCTGVGDCDDCAECNLTTNLCESTCTAEELAQGKICLDSGCGCPPDKPFYDATIDECAECLSGTTHPDDPCVICIQGTWTPKPCSTGNCVDGNCVQCKDSGDCAGNTDGRNCCQPDNSCGCCEGQIYSFTEQRCIDKPACTGPNDPNVPDCFDCVNGEIVPINCPDGYFCVPGKGCVKECDCDNPIPCDATKACVNDPLTNKCYCDECDCDPTSGVFSEGCIQDPNDPNNCIPNPCGNIACNDTPANCDKPGCGCQDQAAGNGGVDKICVPCSQITDCTECNKVPGCTCTDGVNCKEDTDPCSKLSCDDNCSGKPNCTCNGSKCESVDCEDVITLVKNGCQLDFKAETSSPCDCDEITLGLKMVKQGTTLSSILEVRKGSISTASALNSIPLVSDATHPNIMENEEPTQGSVKLSVVRYYRTPDPNDATKFTITITDPLEIFITDLASFGTVTENSSIRVIGNVYDEGTLFKEVYTYQLITDLGFANSCIYDAIKTIGRYTFTESSPTSIDATNTSYWRKVGLSSDNHKYPEVKWYRGLSDSEGKLTGYETVPFRKLYIAPTGVGVYNDSIDKPDDNTFSPDNNGDQHSGDYYKVTIDCSCNGLKTVYYESTCQTPGRLVFCNPSTLDIVLDDCNTIRFNSEFKTTCLSNMDLAALGLSDKSLKYSIYFNGDRSTPIVSETADPVDGVVWSKDEIISHPNDDAISKVEVVFSHDNCEECTLTTEFDVSSFELPVYDERCEGTGAVALDFTIGTTDVVSITYNGDSYTPSGGIITIGNLNLGQTIEVTYVYSGGCKKKDSIVLPDDCCAEYNVTVEQKEGACDDTQFVIEFRVNDAPNVEFSYSVVFDDNGELGLQSGSFVGDKDVSILKSKDPIRIYGTYEVEGCGEETFSLDISRDNTLIVDADNADADGDLDICGTDPFTVTYVLPTGYDGEDVSYRVDGGALQTTQIASDTVSLPVPITGTGITSVIQFENGGSITKAGMQCIQLRPSLLNVSRNEECSVSTLSTVENTVCAGETFPLTIIGTSGCDVVFEVLKDGSFYKNETITLNSGTSYAFPDQPAGSYAIRIVSASSGDCTGVVTANNTIAYTVVAASVLTTTLIACIPDGGAGTSTFTLETRVGGVLTSVDGFTMDGNPLVLANVGTGIYQGTVDTGKTIVAAYTSLSCGIIYTSFIVDCDCSPIGAPTVDDIYYCFGDNPNTYTALAGNNGAAYDVEWTSPTMVVATLAATSPYSLTFAGTYLVRFIDSATGCSSDYTAFNVIEAAEIEVTLLNGTIVTNTIEACDGDTVVIGSNINAVNYPLSYAWSGPNGTIINPNPTLTLTNLDLTTQAGVYTVNVIDSEGCIGSDTITIQAGAGCCNGTPVIDVTTPVNCNFTPTVENSDDASADSGNITLQDNSIVQEALYDVRVTDSCGISSVLYENISTQFNLQVKNTLTVQMDTGAGSSFELTTLRFIEDTGGAPANVDLDVESTGPNIGTVTPADLIILGDTGTLTADLVAYTSALKDVIENALANGGYNTPTNYGILGVTAYEVGSQPVGEIQIKIEITMEIKHNPSGDWIGLPDTAGMNTVYNQGSPVLVSFTELSEVTTDDNKIINNKLIGCTIYDVGQNIDATDLLANTVDTTNTKFNIIVLLIDDVDLDMTGFPGVEVCPFDQLSVDESSTDCDTISTYLWSTGATTATILVPVGSTGYTVHIVCVNGCEFDGSH